MRTTITVIGIVLMWMVMGATYLGHLTSGAMALTEAGLIGAVWMTNLIGRMMEEGY
ncbi:hypothetical protein [Bacillus thuringiensis]|uniref:hypothetical protein n=1 Tax=Bacillus thuringiensis TaxID=1428 RepID=UPI001C3FEC5E|nr:hypothetical protein [Bacillus thuringiensis]